MPRKNLLICFDAFGTLFKPKRPIAKQYGDVARSLGLEGFTDGQVQESFRAAFKHGAKQDPNYGRATGLGAERWWTNIIHNTFKPFGSDGQHLPKELAPRLLHRFSSKEGYTLFPDVLPLLQDLRTAARKGNERLVVGVITNSDDRVPSILESLGMRVSPLRYGVSRCRAPIRSGAYDVDFTVMSYDVGYEKPNRRIFAAADELLQPVQGTTRDSEEVKPESPKWQKLYVGDEYERDVVGALNAGWTAILIDRESPAKQTGVSWPEYQQADAVDAAVAPNAVGFSSLARFAEWQLKQL